MSALMPIPSAHRVTAYGHPVSGPNVRHRRKAVDFPEGVSSALPSQSAINRFLYGEEGSTTISVLCEIFPAASPGFSVWTENAADQGCFDPLLISYRTFEEMLL